MLWSFLVNANCELFLIIEDDVYRVLFDFALGEHLIDNKVKISQLVKSESHQGCFDVVLIPNQM